METCKKCEKEMGFLDRITAKSSNGLCADCTSEKINSAKEKISSLHKNSVENEQVRSAEIETVLLTTETHPDFKITKRIEIVTAECAFGMNVFKDMLASVRDVVGGRSEVVQKTLRETRQTALYELKKEAFEAGANAVVGVDLDYLEISSGGSMLVLIASGTAVVIDL